MGGRELRQRIFQQMRKLGKEGGAHQAAENCSVRGSQIIAEEIKKGCASRKGVRKGKRMT